MIAPSNHPGAGEGAQVSSPPAPDGGPGLLPSAPPGGHGLFFRLLRALRPEEVSFLVFLAVIVAASASEGSWLGSWYQDRIVHVLLIVVMVMVTVRVNRCLWRHDGIDPAALWAELRWSLRVVRDFLGLVMCWSAYMSMRALLDFRDPVDLQLIALERAIFGCDLAVWLQRFVHPTLTNWLSFCYLTLFIYMPLVVGWCLVTGRRRIQREYILALVLAGCMGSFGYWLVPAVGPRIVQAELFTVDLWSNPQVASAARSHDFLLQFNAYPKDCFPSMHTCFSVLSLLFAWRVDRRLFWVCLPFVSSLVFSTVYLRYHYGVDVLAGLALAWAVAVLAPRLLRAWMDRFSLGEADL